MGSDCGSYKYPLFSLLSFLRERKYAYKITTLFLNVLCTPSKISTFESKTNFYEIWSAHYATRGYPKIICFNFLQLVITHAQICQIGPTTVTLHPGTEILHGNRSLKYIPLPLSKFFVKCKTIKLCFFFHYLTNFMYKICFTVSFISCLYMFRAHVLIIRMPKLHYAASGIITLKHVSGLKLLKYNSISSYL